MGLTLAKAETLRPHRKQREDKGPGNPALSFGGIMHFEDIWNEAEAIAKAENLTQDQYLDALKLALDNFPRNPDLNSPDDMLLCSNMVGLMIFQICGITMKLNTNSAEALRIINHERKKIVLGR